MSKRTPLYSVQVASGATFGEWFGWELPVRFGDATLEHRAVRTGVGLIDLSYRRLLELTGKDKGRFLNGMVTNDVQSLKPASGLYAAMLTSHGKLLADMRIYALAEAYYLDLHEELLPKVRQALERHLIADRVETRDLSGEFTLLGLQGPASPELLGRLGTGEAKKLMEYQHLETDIEGVPARLIRSSETGEEGFAIVVPVAKAEMVWAALLHSGSEHRLRPVGMQALNILRIEAGIPWYGLDMDETNLLQEAGLEQAVSFTKGCYIGQETVARIAHRGHVNWRLVGLRIGGAEVPEVGAKLLDEQREVGRITSTVHSPSLDRPIALGYVRRERSEPGTTLGLQSQQGAVVAEIVPLPFYRRQ